MTNLYGRGAWAEMVGVGSAYLVCGGVLRTLSELGRQQARVTTMFAVAVGAATLAGVHNISLLLGTVFLAVVVLAVGPLCFTRSPGKVRDRLEVPAGLSDDELIAHAKSSERVQSHLDGAEPRAFVVPDKLVNFVV